MLAAAANFAKQAIAVVEYPNAFVVGLYSYRRAGAGAASSRHCTRALSATIDRRPMFHFVSAGRRDGSVREFFNIQVSRIAKNGASGKQAEREAGKRPTKKNQAQRA